MNRTEGTHPGQRRQRREGRHPNTGRRRATSEAFTWRILSSTSCSRRSTPERARAPWQAGGRPAGTSGPPSCRSDLALALQGLLGHPPPADTCFISRSTCPVTTTEGNWEKRKVKLPSRLCPIHTPPPPPHEPSSGRTWDKGHSRGHCESEALLTSGMSATCHPH